MLTYFWLEIMVASEWLHMEMMTTFKKWKKKKWKQLSTGADCEISVPVEEFWNSDDQDPEQPHLVEPHSVQEFELEASLPTWVIVWPWY